MAHVAASRALAAATRDRPVNRVAHVAASRALAAYHSVHALRCSWDEHVAASRALAAHEQNLAVPQYSVERSSRTFRTWCGRLWANQLFGSASDFDQKTMDRRKLCPNPFCSFFLQHCTESRNSTKTTTNTNLCQEHQGVRGRHEGRHLLRLHRSAPELPAEATPERARAAEAAPERARASSRDPDGACSCLRRRFEMLQG